jgi:hypothetical protein
MCRNKTSGALLGIILAVVVYGLSSGASFLSKKKKVELLSPCMLKTVLL